MNQFSSSSTVRRTGLKALLLLAVFGLFICPATNLIANDDEIKVDNERLQSIFSGDAPKNRAELAAMQKHFQQLVQEVSSAVVGIQVGNSQGSGVIIDAEGHVLTAGHVVGEPNQEATFIFPDGKRVTGKTLGANNSIDSGMMQITEEGDWPYVEMGNSAKINTGQWVMAIGHPGGYMEGRTPVIRVGRVLTESSSAIQTDCVLVGGDSGGPLFDMSGQVIGINSRIGNDLSFNIHVPIDTYSDTWHRLVKAEKWGSQGQMVRDAGSGRPYIGVSRDADSGEAKISDVTEGGPADKAGIKAGDTIVEFNNRRIVSFDSLVAAVLATQPGDEVKVVVKRNEETVNLMLTIGENTN